MAFVFARDGRDNNLHLIRHAAAIAVVLTHSYSVVFNNYDREPLVSWFGTSIGHYAVGVFFILSGFLITQSLTRNPNLLRFAISRALRIFPGLIVAVAFASLIVGPALTRLDPQGYFASPDLARYIVGALSTLKTGAPLPGLFETLPEATRVNVPLWTLKYEIAAYVLIGCFTACAALIGRGFGPFAVFTMVGLCVAVRAVSPLADLSMGITNTIHMFLMFFLGAAAYHLRHRMPLTGAGAIMLAGFAVLAGRSPLGEFAEALFLTYLVMWIAFLPGLAPATRKLEAIGDMSFGIYIFAYPIQQSLRLAYPAIDPLSLFALTLALTVPLAYASWHLMESPCLDARDGLAARLRRGRRVEGKAASA